MTRPHLPEAQRRVPISVSLSPRAVAILDAFVEGDLASTRSAAVELAIAAADEMNEASGLRRRPRKAKR